MKVPANLKTPASGWFRPVLLALAAAPLLLSGAGCGQEDGFAAEPETGGAAAPDTRPIVEAAVIASGFLADVLEIAGRLEPRAEVMVSSELGGAVEEVRFDKGRPGGTGRAAGPGRFGPAAGRAGRSRGGTRRGTPGVHAGDSNWSSVRRVPLQDFLGAEVNVKRFEARVESARLRLTRSEITAPASGVIVQRDIEPGEVLGPGSPVAVLHDTAVLRATIGIPETDISFFSVGSPAAVSLDAYPDRSFDGRITYIAPTATRPRRSFEAEVEVDNADGTLRSGLIVRTGLQRRVFEDAVVVARDALVERDGILHAFVLEDGTAGLRSITLGPDEGDRVVITAGLEVGETLITNGHRNLVDGQPVRLASRIPDELSEENGS